MADSQIWDPKKDPWPDTVETARVHIERFGVPGNRASNPIPPADDPRYRAFQKALGLHHDEHISFHGRRLKARQ